MDCPLLRFQENPILTVKDVKPSASDLQVECLLNPGAFQFEGRTGLLLRVAERPIPEEGWTSTVVLDSTTDGGVRIVKFRSDDPKLNASDPRVFVYDGEAFLTTLSHLRLAWSDDGVNFSVDEEPTLTGVGELESFGVEDCRVEFIEGLYWLTYTAVSPVGAAVGLISTGDWKSFTRHGVIFPPANKDCALFPEKIDGTYWALHRPSAAGANHIWLSRSPSLHQWGAHQCIAGTRPGLWDCERIGAGAAPIRTDKGWLVIYHGADAASRYCLGLMLLDLQDPSIVLARRTKPIFEPLADYEREGFFGNVVFTNGHVVDGDEVIVYYGAADWVICGAKVSLNALLQAVITSS